MTTALLSFPARGAGAVSAAIAVLLAGCVNLAPSYQTPALPVPPTLADAPRPAVGTAAVNDPGAVPLGQDAGPMDWRAFVQERRLADVIALSLANNRDLRVALLAIERARAQYGIQQAGLLPQVNATAGGSRSRTADDLTTAGRSNTTEQYSAQLGFASYEIDFFGRVRNLNDAALQEFLRTAESRRSVELSLIADVANAWLTLDADARRLRLARETLRTRQQSLDVTRQAHALGGVSGLTLAQTQTTVDSARVDVATYAAQVARDRNVLALLAGAPVPPALLPDSVAAAEAADAVPAAAATGSPGDTLRTTSSAPLAPPPPPATALLAVPADLPATVLLRRPDVQAAEYALRGSYASIGAARAAFFPSITLTGSVGTASNALSGLFDGGNRTWSFAPQIRLPIFTAGLNQANLQVAQVARDTAIAQYDKSIQTAFREVADALADRATLQERIAAQASLVDATQRALDLSVGRFRLGADSYLAVLDAQRTLYTAQQTQISLQLAEQANRITLYKALGGGWAGGPAPAPD